ncbi:unnamed protein product [Mytilus coruscus]|uniref:B box-type domain-containing protein n=1 Tax=Mytilus coruscus TaxID=42192 RepID=A0A6J8DSR6_MYTCO|nr:unnamed protein product [Mytilus coruscus]
MASTTPVCVVCNVHNITEPSVTWCKECDEGLCLKCQEHHSLSNGTLNHSTVPITEYEKLLRDNLQIVQNCNKHNEDYIIYCKKHESLCCGRCIVESQNDCGDFAKLTDIQNRENNLTSLSERKRHILHEIKQTRETINKHLDEIQDDAINEINAAEEKENMNICHSLMLLQEKGNEIAECQRNITKIKKLDTDLQTFIAMKKLEIEVSNKEERQTSTNSASAELIRSVENVNLKLHSTLDNTEFCKWGCCMLPDGRYAFTETLNNLVRVFKTDRSKDFEVKTKYRAFNIAYISEDKTLAVTSGKNGMCIAIIDLQNKQIKKEIYADSYYHGLAVMDNKLICSAYKKGIQWFNPNDNSTRVIVQDEFPTMFYIATLMIKFTTQITKPTP